MTDNHDVNWLLAISSDGLSIVAQLLFRIGSEKCERIRSFGKPIM
jgi:hypothetical protein